MHPLRLGQSHPLPNRRTHGHTETYVRGPSRAIPQNGPNRSPSVQRSTTQRWGRGPADTSRTRTHVYTRTGTRPMCAVSTDDTQVSGVSGPFFWGRGPPAAFPQYYLFASAMCGLRVLVVHSVYKVSTRSTRAGRPMECVLQGPVRDGSGAGRGGRLRNLRSPLGVPICDLDQVSTVWGLLLRGLCFAFSLSMCSASFGTAPSPSCDVACFSVASVCAMEVVWTGAHPNWTSCDAGKRVSPTLGSVPTFPPPAPRPRATSSSACAVAPPTRGCGVALPTAPVCGSSAVGLAFAGPVRRSTCQLPSGKRRPRGRVWGSGGPGHTCVGAP